MWLHRMKPETPGVLNLAHITHNSLNPFDFISVELNVKSHFLLAAGEIIFHGAELSLMKKKCWLKFSCLIKLSPGRTTVLCSPWIHDCSAPKKTHDEIQFNQRDLITPCASEIHQFPNDWKLLNWSWERAKKRESFKSMKHKITRKEEKRCTCPSVQFAIGQRLFARSFFSHRCFKIKFDKTSKEDYS